MDFLNKSIQQIGELLKAMSPAARVTAGLLLAVVVISLVYLFKYQGNSPDDYLLSAKSFSSSELAAMEAAFSQAGLNQYEIEGTKVRIPRAQRSAYLAALAEYDALPNDFDNILSTAHSTNSPFEPQAAREQRIQYAKQQMLARIISDMQGIENATVFYDEVVEPGLRGQRKVTALVSVKPSGSSSLDSKLVESIRRLVAGGKAGMKPEDVVVTDLATGTSYVASSGNGMTQSSNLYAEQKRLYEEWYHEKIFQHLGSFIPGVQVGINAELDPQVEHQSTRIDVDTRVVPIRNIESSRIESTSFGQPGGQVGVVPNAGTNQAATLATATQGTEIEERTAIAENKPSQEFQQTTFATLTPKEVTVSVAVPSDYYESLWRERNPAEEGSEPVEPDVAGLQQIEQEVKTKIEEQLVQMIPAAPQGESNWPRVVVTSFQRLSTPEPEGPSYAATASTWFAEYGGKVGMVVVGLVGLLFLRSVVRGGASPAPTPEAAEGAETLRVHEPSIQDEPEAEGEAPARRKRRFATGGPNLRDELADMVREDPDTAANILKSWISDAA